ncbi:MAG: signal recognition particle-docking protein FtsY [candidate division KSB1 bacterium]|jgi:fused signal recognition particle receptor|nr:signal recognition particle-docking protein FtsY [candidate division KSB1 bacterium]
MFGRLKSGLSKTRVGFVEKINSAVRSSKEIDEDLFERIEEIMIGADIGVKMTMQLIENVQAKVDDLGIKKPENVMNFLKSALQRVVESNESERVDQLFESTAKPHVIMVVGVNGTGKTTTIGKLAQQFKDQGKKVLLSAADTFRAAASEQLEIWAERAGADIVKNQPGADPASVAFDSYQAALSRGVDYLIVDTAGRLHTKMNLMEELKKIKRVLGKIDEHSPHSTLLVMDATTGQNGMSQAKQFTRSVDVSGIVLTKLDGTAKGGIVLAIKEELGVPVQFIGVGEQIDDLQPFDAQEFVEALFE